MTKEDIRKKKAQIKKTHAKITKTILTTRKINNKIIDKLFFHSDLDRKKLYKMVIDIEPPSEKEDLLQDLESYLFENLFTIDTINFKSSLVQFVIDYHIDLFENDISSYVDYISCLSPDSIFLFDVLKSKHITKNQILEISNFFKRLSKKHLSGLAYSSSTILGFINTVNVLTK